MAADPYTDRTTPNAAVSHGMRSSRRRGARPAKA